MNIQRIYTMKSNTFLKAAPRRVFFGAISGAVALSLALGGINSARADGSREVDKLKFPKLNKLEIPKVDKRQLSNGVEVYLLEDHSLPTFNASVRMRVGSYLEPADKIGLASILGDVMRTGGTKKWTGDELDEKLEGVGATVETGIGQTSGSAFANSLIEYSDLALDALSQVLRYPTFDQDKIDLSKTQAKGGISRRNDDAQQIASRIFSAALYGADSPYARYPEYETIDAISREDLLKFHKEFIHPKNLQIAVWGDFDKDEMFKKIESYFGAWKDAGEKAPAPPAVVEHKDNRVKFAEKSDVNQTNIYVGHLGGKIQDEDYPTRLVMNNIFGGGFGSRLFGNVRSREGLAYATGGGYRSSIDHRGRFFGFASTKSETTVKAAKAIVAQMESMKTDPPTDEEMHVAIDGYMNSFVFNFDTRAKVINRMVQYDAYGLPQDFLSQVKEKVEKVTPADVQAAAKKYFDLDHLIYSVVGKSEDFDAPLTELGPVDTVDITIPTGAPKTDFVVNDENIKKGKEILSAAIEATGGKTNYAKIKSFSRSGDMTVDVGGGNMMTFQSSAIFEVPDKRAMTITTPMGEMKRIFDGSQGWQAMGGKSAPIPETELTETKQEISRDILVLFCTYEKNGLTPVYGGSGEENGSSVDYVHIINDAGDELVRLAVDASSHLPVAQHYFGKTSAGPGAIDVYYSDFKDVDGLKTPFSAKAMANGATVMEATTSDLVINAEVTAATFAKP